MCRLASPWFAVVCNGGKPIPLLAWSAMGCRCAAVLLQDGSLDGGMLRSFIRLQLVETRAAEMASDALQNIMMREHMRIWATATVTDWKACETALGAPLFGSLDWTHDEAGSLALLILSD